MTTDGARGDIAHIGHAELLTPDLQRSAWFFGDVLGMEEEARTESSRFFRGYGDYERYVNTYWSKWDIKTYFPGDGARRDRHGNFWLLGRVDDVLNVAGHRIGTMEVESALVDHPSVAEAAVVGKNHDLKGQALAAFVTVKDGRPADAALNAELKQHVVQKIGALARPDDIIFTPELPKTRSGKIMRRLLRDIAEGRELGDVTTLREPGVMQDLAQKVGTEET